MGKDTCGGCFGEFTKLTELLTISFKELKESNEVK